MTSEIVTKQNSEKIKQQEKKKPNYLNKSKSKKDKLLEDQKDEMRKKKKIEELDEASRLQRRTKYLLLKMKLEQNLIDAYSTEGWKGQSREKIKPENELRRAKKQILKCKLGIRDVIHQLDMLSSIGCINDSAVAKDGSVHHEHIICAKCKLREAFYDNDIILCDGTCNRAFHQKCLDPPLLTKDIPPGEEGWFCKFCKSKIEILEAINAHLGTVFASDSNWQDIFKEEAKGESESSLLCRENEWPSDESDDNDYDPDNINLSESDESDDICSSVGSLEDEMLFLNGKSQNHMINDNDNDSDCEILSGSRNRPFVDYIKLNDEMFGKNTLIEEQVSEDEDWGPSKLKRPRIITCEKNIEDEKQKELSVKTESKRSLFRIPVNKVEQLRIVFAENELPSRDVKENLAKKLGLNSDKVNKWFKNARYSALKSRKADEEKPCERINLVQSEPVEIEQPNSKRGGVDLDENMSREKATKEKEIEAEKDMEKVCRLKERIQKLKEILVNFPNGRSNNNNKAVDEPSIIFVPVAELKVKR